MIYDRQGERLFTTTEILDRTEIEDITLRDLIKRGVILPYLDQKFANRFYLITTDSIKKLVRYFRERSVKNNRNEIADSMQKLLNDSDSLELK